MRYPALKNGVILKTELEVVQSHWNGAARVTINDFLLVRHYNYSSILYHFRVFWTFSNIVTLKSGLDVTQDHLNWCHSKAWCGFLFAVYSNYGAIVYRLRDIVVIGRKSRNFYTPRVFIASESGDPFGIPRRCLILINVKNAVNWHVNGTIAQLKQQISELGFWLWCTLPTNVNVQYD